MNPTGNSNSVRRSARLFATLAMTLALTLGREISLACSGNAAELPEQSQIDARQMPAPKANSQSEGQNFQSPQGKSLTIDQAMFANGKARHHTQGKKLKQIMIGALALGGLTLYGSTLLARRHRTLRRRYQQLRSRSSLGCAP